MSTRGVQFNHGRYLTLALLVEYNCRNNCRYDFFTESIAVLSNRKFRPEPLGLDENLRSRSSIFISRVQVTQVVSSHECVHFFLGSKATAACLMPGSRSVWTIARASSVAALLLDVRTIENYTVQPVFTLVRRSHQLRFFISSAPDSLTVVWIWNANRHLVAIGFGGFYRRSIDLSIA